MDGIVIIDVKNGRNFLYSDNGTKKELRRIEEQSDLVDLINLNRNKAFILLFDNNDKLKNFVRGKDIPERQIWDWMSVVWGEEKRLQVTVVNSSSDNETYIRGKSSFGGFYRERVVYIGDVEVPGAYCYTREEFYDKLLNAAIAKYQDLQAAKSVQRQKERETPPAVDLSAVEASLASINKKLDMSARETTLDAINIKLDKLLNQSVSRVSAPSRFAADGNETIKRLDYIIELLGQMSSGGSSVDDSLVNELKTQLNEYKVDFYFKAMRKQGVDAMLDIVEYLYTCMEEGDEQQNAILQKVLKRMERTLRDKLNVRMESSEAGVPFDENRMISYPGDAIMTDDERMHNTVARSVRPAFYWTMPMVNGQGGEHLFKEEVVILYKYQ